MSNNGSRVCKETRRMQSEMISSLDRLALGSYSTKRLPQVQKLATEISNVLETAVIARKRRQ